MEYHIVSLSTDIFRPHPSSIPENTLHLYLQIDNNSNEAIDMLGTYVEALSLDVTYGLESLKLEVLHDVRNNSNEESNIDTSKTNFISVINCCRNLKRLDLRSFKLRTSKSWLAYLQSANQLQHLDLSYNSIGDEGAEALSKSLSSLIALQHLILSYNSIGDEGAEALSKSLSSLIALQHLYLSGNSIRYEGILAIVSLLLLSLMRYLRIFLVYLNL